MKQYDINIRTKCEMSTCKQNKASRRKRKALNKPWISSGWALLVAQLVKNPPRNAGDLGLIPGLGRSPRGGRDNLLQYSCLENPLGRGTWWTTVHKLAKSQTRLKWHAVNSKGLHCEHCTCFLTSFRAFGRLPWSQYGPPSVDLKQIDDQIFL